MLSHKQSTDIKIPNDKQINDHINNCNNKPKVHTDIGALLRQIGVWCQSDYLEISTSTYIYKYFEVLDNLLSNNNYKKLSVSDSNCYDKIKAEGIAVVAGYCDEGGHGWVIDGVGNINYYITRYYNYNYLNNYLYSHKIIIF